MKLKHIILLSIFMLMGIGESAAQNNKDWVVIASKIVSFKADTDIVYPLGNEKRVSKIKVKCTQGTLKLKKVTVYMANGERKEYEAKGVGVLAKGMSSFAFDLPGNGEKLEKIELQYETAGNLMVSKRAHVDILGRLTEN